MKLARRGFIQGMGALGAAAGVSLDAVAQAVKTARPVAKAKAAARAPLQVKHVKSGCSICPNFCGIDVTVVNGVVRTIYPDTARAEFYNHGICPKGASGMYNTYDAYRLKKPLKRTNPNKGRNEDPRWAEISWDEAFEIVAARMAKIHAEDPRKLLWQHGQGKYLTGENFAVAFTKAFGTPNMTHRTTTCEAARHVADELTVAGAGILPDLKHAKYMLNFGSSYFEGEQASRWWLQLLRRRTGFALDGLGSPAKHRQGFENCRRGAALVAECGQGRRMGSRAPRQGPGDFARHGQSHDRRRHHR